MKYHARNLALWVTLTAAVNLAAAGQKDLSPARKRQVFAAVRRVAVVPPFFGVDLEVGTPTEPESRAEIEQARTLLTHAREMIPRQLSERTPFEVLPAQDVSSALQSLSLTPEKLFQGEGKMKNMHFALPDAARIKLLATTLHADAVILTTLDAPVKKKAQYSANIGSGIAYEAAHVSCKAAFYVDSSDGTEVLHDYVEALHPLTAGKGRSYVLADWQEATDTVIQDFLDELSRYTPEKK